MLHEKCMAKLHLCYEGIDGGFSRLQLNLVSQNCLGCGSLVSSVVHLAHALQHTEPPTQLVVFR